MLILTQVIIDPCDLNEAALEKIHASLPQDQQARIITKVVDVTDHQAVSQGASPNYQRTVWEMEAHMPVADSNEFHYSKEARCEGEQSISVLNKSKYSAYSGVSLAGLTCSFSLRSPVLSRNLVACCRSPHIRVLVGT